MAVATTQTIVQYQGNDSTVSAYPVPFPFHDEGWLRVQVLDPAGNVSELELGGGFAASGAGDPGGGEITTVEAWDSTHVVTIFREVPITQLLELLYNDRLPAALVERALDKLTFILQQLAGNAASGDRSLRFPFSEPAAHGTTLPVPVVRRDSVVYFDPVTGELHVLRMDQLAQRLLVILGADSLLPYRVREINVSSTLEAEDSNSFLRCNAAWENPIVITLPTTEDTGIDETFSVEVSRIGAASVEFLAADGVVLESDSGKYRIFGQFTSVAVRCVGVNRWQIYGDLY